MKFFKLSSLSLSLTVLSVFCGVFSAQAETASTTFNDTISIPATTSVVEAPVTEANKSVSSEVETEVVTEAAIDSAIATETVIEANTEVANTPAIAPAEVTATTVPSATLDSLTAQPLLAHHTPGHGAATTTEAAATIAPEPAEVVAETKGFAPESTTAVDLAPATEPTNNTADALETSEPSQVAQIPTSPVLTRPPGNNYIGGGVNFGDDTSFAVVSKFAITQFSDYGVSLRPSVLFGDSVNFRVPITIESRLNTESEQVNRFAPYAGVGVAIDTDDDGEGDTDLDNLDDNDDDDVGFMLTAGSDFLLTNRITATAGVNLIFNDDTDLELLLGVGYNF